MMHIFIRTCYVTEPQMTTPKTMRHASHWHIPCSRLTENYDSIPRYILHVNVYKWPNGLA